MTRRGHMDVRRAGSGLPRRAAPLGRFPRNARPGGLCPGGVRREGCNASGRSAARAAPGRRRRHHRGSALASLEAQPRGVGDLLRVACWLALRGLWALFPAQRTRLLRHRGTRASAPGNVGNDLLKHSKLRAGPFLQRNVEKAPALEASWLDGRVFPFDVSGGHRAVKHRSTQHARASLVRRSTGPPCPLRRSRAHRIGRHGHRVSRL